MWGRPSADQKATAPGQSSDVNALFTQLSRRLDEEAKHRKKDSEINRLEAKQILDCLKAQDARLKRVEEDAVDALKAQGARFKKIEEDLHKLHDDAYGQPMPVAAPVRPSTEDGTATVPKQTGPNEELLETITRLDVRLAVLERSVMQSKSDLLHLLSEVEAFVSGIQQEKQAFPDKRLPQVKAPSPLTDTLPRPQIAGLQKVQQLPVYSLGDYEVISPSGLRGDAQDGDLEELASARVRYHQTVLDLKEALRSKDFTSDPTGSSPDLEKKVALMANNLQIVNSQLKISGFEALEDFWI